MGAYGAIALPSRYVEHDAVPAQFDGYGGANGTVALPGRQDALEAGGPFDRPGQLPPTDGAWGPIQAFKAMFNWSARVRIPLASPTQYGWDNTLYVRRYFRNVLPFLHHSMPQEGTTDWTLNRVPGVDGPPSSPIPVYNRWLLYTLREPFDTRVHADYWKPEQFQRALHRDQYLAGQRYQMVRPYFPRLTQWSLAPSYSSTTETVG
jgi:hypothetical protein